ncbi:MAG: exodeoxyribonuclease VII large subunit [Saprospiraceae bacterium]|nr:exodeoxyribonuclease VII large subunit [Saprospiraceae bacterium]
MEALRLSRLNELIRRTIALNFSEPIWIIAELIQGKLNKGHFYMELAERADDNEIVAQSSAVIWKSTYLLIEQHRDSSILKEGNELRIKVQVEYHPRFGLKLNVIDLDPQYTLGQIAKQRQAIISRLIDEGLWQQNKNLELPKVLKSIAVITSLTAAGKQDFEEHLIENEWGYTFAIHYYPAVMQGQNTSTEVCNALSRINDMPIGSFDCVVMIRGGGAKLDLIDFDHFEISKSICKMRIPVLTGIGHQQDESIADMNAFFSLKTPTAVADYIVNRNFEFETEVVSIFESISNFIQSKLRSEAEKLNYLKSDYYSSVYLYLNTVEGHFRKTGSEVLHSFMESIHKKENELISLKHLIDSNNPQFILEKGYSLVYQGKKRIKSMKDLDPSLSLKTVFVDGLVKSKIEI